MPKDKGMLEFDLFVDIVNEDGFVVNEAGFS